MRKYLLNTSLIGAVTGAWSVVKATRSGPRDWRLVLLWVSWGISVALAVGAVREQGRIERGEIDG
ncbi:hypothetical protein [Mycetocola reblochoni]|uniref:Uncharacterized protein n=2 Tax=Mycetocola reblochoni TaxID=331618 RepID=A0A1R4JA11_9MICO|nr:hypothetical protein [Mycetocola reblochoni]RLP70045.1 hypothetical protein D9V30_05100 [Mycetocola reblochoni]SJN28971.1 hypothetical protein FM119_06315 [Mycetocola reblochoni REB411]